MDSEIVKAREASAANLRALNIGNKILSHNFHANKLSQYAFDVPFRQSVEKRGKHITWPIQALDVKLPLSELEPQYTYADSTNQLNEGNNTGNAAGVVSPRPTMVPNLFAWELLADKTAPMSVHAPAIHAQETGTKRSICSETQEMYDWKTATKNDYGSFKPTAPTNTIPVYSEFLNPYLAYETMYDASALMKQGTKPNMTNYDQTPYDQIPILNYFAWQPLSSYLSRTEAATATARIKQDNNEEAINTTIKALDGSTKDADKLVPTFSTDFIAAPKKQADINPNHPHSRSTSELLAPKRDVSPNKSRVRTSSESPSSLVDRLRNRSPARISKSHRRSSTTVSSKDDDSVFQRLSQPKRHVSPGTRRSSRDSLCGKWSIARPKSRVSDKVPSSEVGVPVPLKPLPKRPKPEETVTEALKRTASASSLLEKSIKRLSVTRRKKYEPIVDVKAVNPPWKRLQTTNSAVTRKMLAMLRAARSEAAADDMADTLTADYEIDADGDAYDEGTDIGLEPDTHPPSEAPALEPAVDVESVRGGRSYGQSPVRQSTTASTPRPERNEADTSPGKSIGRVAFVTDPALKPIQLSTVGKRTSPSTPSGRVLGESNDLNADPSLATVTRDFVPTLDFLSTAVRAPTPTFKGRLYAPPHISENDDVPPRPRSTPSNRPTHRHATKSHTQIIFPRYPTASDAQLGRWRSETTAKFVKA